ncbi:Integrase catalytic domain-containing protein [Citrus sinensis]|nr:Integrase catalytic domain-containing protein [Citrus sinensis]
MADYAKLRIFGCIAYAHVKQGKLEPRALKCRFMGYPKGVKGYRLWCVNSKPPQCIISRYVRFHEEELLKKPRSPINNTESGTEIDKVKFQVEPQNLKELEPETKGAEIEPEVDVEHESAESEEYTYGIPGAEPRRFKARLVARGFTQNEEIDFTEVFSPVVRHASIRIILALVAVQDMHLEQMDVKIVFLRGELQEEIVMQQPEGYMTSGKEDYVYLLKKFLYGLKQSPRQWYMKFDNFMITHAFNREEINHLKKLLSREFEMKELREPKRILGMDIIRNKSKKSLFLTQQSYIQKVLVRFGMNDAQPDNSHAVSLVSKFMANPGYEHWRAVQWIIRYLKGTLEVGLVYGGEGKNGHTLIGYVDADFAGDLDKRRSQTWYLFTLEGCTVNWKATLQNEMALSTTEVEYTTVAEALKEAIWLKVTTTELGAK